MSNIYVHKFYFKSYAFTPVAGFRQVLKRDNAYPSLIFFFSFKLMQIIRKWKTKQPSPFITTNDMYVYINIFIFKDNQAVLIDLDGQENFSHSVSGSDPAKSDLPRNSAVFMIDFGMQCIFLNKRPFIRKSISKQFAIKRYDKFEKINKYETHQWH